MGQVHRPHRRPRRRREGGPRAKAIAVGKYLGAKVDRPVGVTETKEGPDGKDACRTGIATLKVKDGRARERVYWFEVTWQDGDEAEDTDSRTEENPPDPVDADRRPPTHGGSPESSASKTVVVVNGGNDEAWG